MEKKTLRPGKLAGPADAECCTGSNIWLSAAAVSPQAKNELNLHAISVVKNYRKGHIARPHENHRDECPAVIKVTA